MMKITFQTEVTPATRNELVGILTKQLTLEHVSRWLYKQSPPLNIKDVITQDEFTHDVIIPIWGKLVIVYDCTHLGKITSASVWGYAPSPQELLTMRLRNKWKPRASSLIGGHRILGYAACLHKKMVS